MRRLLLSSAAIIALASPLAAQANWVAPSPNAQVRQLLAEAVNAKLRLGPQAGTVRLADGRRVNEPFAACSKVVSVTEPVAAACVRVGLAVERAGAGSGEMLFTRACGFGSAVGCALWARSLEQNGFTDLAALVQPSTPVATGDIAQCERGVDVACGVAANPELTALAVGYAPDGVSAEYCTVASGPTSHQSQLSCAMRGTSAFEEGLYAATRAAFKQVNLDAMTLDAAARFTGNRSTGGEPRTIR